MLNRKHEVICIQSGQAGVQLGHAMWELLTIEHDISASGIINNEPEDVSFNTFFSQSSDDQYFPRALIFDTEPTVMDEIRCGYYRKLFHPEMLVNGKEDASNNFARGYLTEAKRMLYNLVEKSRRMIENCENFAGFLVQSGTAGGTGSGLLSALLEHLLTEFAGRTNVQLSIFPGEKLSNCIVQPYNCILSTEKLVYISDLNIIVDNEILYSICCNQLDIERPSFSNINRIISPLLSGLTAPIRFQGMINSDLKEISTNLVPYPSLHFPLASYAPLVSDNKFDHDLLNNELLTRSLFQQENQLIDVDLKDGYFLSSVLLYRGNCDLSSILKTVQTIKKEKDFHWVDWCPTGFKISHTVQKAISIPLHGPMNYDKAGMMVTNHSGIGSTLTNMEKKFNILFQKKAYLHWYLGEGMEESEFRNAMYEVNIISKDYSNIVENILSNDTYTDSHSAKPSSDESTNTVSSNLENKLQIILEKEKSGDVADKFPLIVKQSSGKIYEMTKSDLPPILFQPFENKMGEEIEYGIHLHTPFTHEETTNWPSGLNKYSNVKTTVDSFRDSKNVSNMIYEICERNYVTNSFKNFGKKKQVLRQISLSKDNSNGNIIKKMYRRNKDLFNKFRHSQQYNLTT